VEEPRGDNEGYYYYLVGNRLETDEEKSFRICAETHRNKDQLCLELKEYKRLKAKFEIQ
jgi:hypothetical protein